MVWRRIGRETAATGSIWGWQRLPVNSGRTGNKSVARRDRFLQKHHRRALGGPSAPSVSPEIAPAAALTVKCNRLDYNRDRSVARWIVMSAVAFLNRPKSNLQIIVNGHYVFQGNMCLSGAIHVCALTIPVKMCQNRVCMLDCSHKWKFVVVHIVFDKPPLSNMYCSYIRTTYHEFQYLQRGIDKYVPQSTITYKKILFL